MQKDKLALYNEKWALYNDKQAEYNINRQHPNKTKHDKITHEQWIVAKIIPFTIFYISVAHTKAVMTVYIFHRRHS